MFPNWCWTGGLTINTTNIHPKSNGFPSIRALPALKRNHTIHIDITLLLLIAMVSNLVILVVAAFAATARAFRIPAELPDGSYGVVTNDTGTVEFVRLDDIDLAAAAGPSSNSTHLRSKRVDVEWPSDTFATCSGNFFFASDFLQYSYNGFYQSCWYHNTQGGRFTDKKALFQKYGTSVAYMCNYSSKGNPCDTNEWAQAIHWLQGVCRWTSQGWGQGGEYQSTFLL